MMQNDFGMVSIIMAAYNAEKTIEQAINSVLNQTYTDFELLARRTELWNWSKELPQRTAVCALFLMQRIVVCLTHASTV